MTDHFGFIVYSRAASQGSKRNLGNGIMIESSKRVKPYRADVRGVALSAVPSDWDLDRDINLDLTFCFKRPKSHLTSKGLLTKSAPAQPRGRSYGDIDKLCRATLDALTGVCYHDDSQVLVLTGRKLFSERNQVILHLSYV